MNPKTKSVKINNGLEMPKVGLGVWQIPNDKVVGVVRWALDAGYRHIDTAKVYGNEIGVGEAITRSQIPRKELFITTKLAIQDLFWGQKAFEESLAKLKLDYVDLYLIHWPFLFWQKAWKSLEMIYKSGRAKAIGVSNFGIERLEELKTFSQITPAVNQVEISPFLRRQQLVEYCHSKGIAVESYSPLTHGKKLTHPVIQRLAEKHHKTPAQIMIRWGLQHDLIVIPKSQSKEHIKSNIQVFDFRLTSEDMQKLDALDENSSEFPLWSRG